MRLEKTLHNTNGQAVADLMFRKIYEAGKLTVSSVHIGLQLLFHRPQTLKKSLRQHDLSFSA